MASSAPNTRRSQSGGGQNREYTSQFRSVGRDSRPGFGLTAKPVAVYWASTRILPDIAKAASECDTYLLSVHHARLRSHRDMVVVVVHM